MFIQLPQLCIELLLNAKYSRRLGNHNDELDILQGYRYRQGLCGKLLFPTLAIMKEMIKKASRTHKGVR